MLQLRIKKLYKNAELEIEIIKELKFEESERTHFEVQNSVRL